MIDCYVFILSALVHIDILATELRFYSTSDHFSFLCMLIYYVFLYVKSHEYLCGHAKVPRRLETS
jgi:hypothetical protein